MRHPNPEWTRMPRKRPPISPEHPRRRGRPTNDEAARRMLAAVGVDPSAIDPERILAAVASDAGASSTARVRAAIALLRARKPGKPQGKRAAEAAAAAEFSVDDWAAGNL